MCVVYDEVYVYTHAYTMFTEPSQRLFRGRQCTMVATRAAVLSSPLSAL